MRYIEDGDGAYFDPEVKSLDGDEFLVYNIDGYGGETGLELGGYILTWSSIDKIKAAIALAEAKWRR